MLHASPFSEEGDVLSLNLARGCAYGCTFCPVRAHTNSRGASVLLAYRSTAEQLDAELTACKNLPRAVFLSPATDPFPPYAELQEETARILDVLACHGVEAWLMTRGCIRPAALEALARHRQRVRVTVALTTLDRRLQRLLEPLTAPPALRLRHLRELKQHGVRVQAALDPLLPGLTDTRESLLAVLEQLVGAGVRRVTAGYLFLRQGIRDNLAQALEPLGLADTVLSAYDAGPTLAGARYLPKPRRQRGYAALMALAAGFDIQVSVCRTTNPDFAAPRRSRPASGHRQPFLPLLA